MLLGYRICRTRSTRAIRVGLCSTKGRRQRKSPASRSRRSLKGEAHHDLRQVLPPDPLLGKGLGLPKQRLNDEAGIQGPGIRRPLGIEGVPREPHCNDQRNGRISRGLQGTTEQGRRDYSQGLPASGRAGVRELTLRGQRGATGSASKMGSESNAAVGAAYELMGSAALTARVSQPVNAGASPLFIQSGKDIVTFGDKSNLNRRSEAKLGILPPAERSNVMSGLVAQHSWTATERLGSTSSTPRRWAAIRQRGLKEPSRERC